MTTDPSRRDVLRGLAGILLAGAAPFYVRPTSLMRVKPIVVPKAPYEWMISWYGPHGLIREQVIPSETQSLVLRHMEFPPGAVSCVFYGPTAVGVCGEKRANELFRFGGLDKLVDSIGVRVS